MPGLIAILIVLPSLLLPPGAPAASSGSPLAPIAAAVVQHVASERADAASGLVVDAPVVAAPAPAPNPSNLLASADGSLRVGLGIYSDCSGWSPVGREVAYMNVCYGRTYFIGHNPGVFTPLMHMQVGDVIDWYDGGAALHRLRVVSVRVVSRFGGVPVPFNGKVVAQFQTCEVLDGSYDRILDAEAS